MLLLVMPPTGKTTLGLCNGLDGLFDYDYGDHDGYDGSDFFGYGSSLEAVSSNYQILISWVFKMLLYSKLWKYVLDHLCCLSFL